MSSDGLKNAVHTTTHWQGHKQLNMQELWKIKSSWILIFALNFLPMKLSWKICVLVFSCQNQHFVLFICGLRRPLTSFFSAFLKNCTFARCVHLWKKMQMNTCMLAWTCPIWAAPGWGCSACSWRGEALVNGPLCGSRWATQWCKLLPWTKKNL